jgi:cell division protein FtsL
MSLRSIIDSARRKPHSLKHQFRWKLVPRFIWRSVQSFHITLLVWGLVTIGCIFYLTQWMNYRQVGHRVDSLETQRSILVSKLELLEVEISYLTRPQRLEALAEKTMLMASPDTIQYQLSWVDVSSSAE